jgi:hypothetical protein
MKNKVEDKEHQKELLIKIMRGDEELGLYKDNKKETETSSLSEEEIEKQSTYYAHNYFDMHETNNYKALKQGFEAGVNWAINKLNKK